MATCSDSSSTGSSSDFEGETSSKRTKREQGELSFNMYLSLVHNMTMLGLTFLSIKIVSFHRQERGCSSELLRRNASNARIEIEIKSIPWMSLKGGPDRLAIP